MENLSGRQELAVPDFPSTEFNRCQTLEELESALKDADVLVIGNRAFTPEVAEVTKQHAQRLAWVQFTTSGIDNARTFGLPEGVTVTNAAGLRSFQSRNIQLHCFLP